MRYLIDGYNLLHAIGAIRPSMRAAQLSWVRRRLGSMLRAAHARDAGCVTVVFDAAGAPRGIAELEDHDGILFHFAVHQQEADDLIEDLIRRDSAPQQLAVVSDDHRIQRAARRRSCRVLACSAYLDEIEQQQRRSSRNSVAPDEKASAAAEGAPDPYLAEFAHLENDPELKAFFDLDRFPGADAEQDEP